MILRRIVFGLIALYAVLPSELYAQCTGCTDNINGNNSSQITVSGTKKYCFNSGTFTGSINGIEAGASVCISPNAVFKPNNMNNWRGIVYNYGEVNMNNANMAGNGELHNFNNLKVNGLNMEWNGSNKVFNEEDAVITLSNLNLTPNASFTNHGEATVNDVNFNGGTFVNNGKTTANGNANLSNNSSFTTSGELTIKDLNFNGGTFVNNGTVTASGNANLNNNNSFTTNGELTIQKDLNHSSAVFINSGTVSVGGNHNLSNNNSSFTNNGEMSIQKDLNHSNAVFTNNGKTTVGGAYNLSGTINNHGDFRFNANGNFGGSADIKNYCMMISGGIIYASTSKFRNEGFIWVLNNLFQNSGTYFQTSGAQLRGKDFANSGTISGGGKYYFSHQTSNSGNVGNDGAGLNFYDASRGNQSLFFDQQNKAPHGSVTKNAFIPADTSSWGGGSADAGNDQNICVAQAVLSAAGTGGTWSLVSGSGSVQEVNNPNSAVTGLGVGANIFRWAIPSTCGVAIDEVIITRNAESPETTWTGAENNDWHNPNNWTHCVPSPVTKAIITNTAHKPVIHQNKTGVAGKVELLSGSDLEISSGASLYVNELGE